MSAKSLCAMLITRSLKDLTEEEEEIVADYLHDMGVSVRCDAGFNVRQTVGKIDGQRIGQESPYNRFR